MSAKKIARALIALALTSLAGALTSAAGCSGKVIPQGGLMLVVRTDGTLSQADRLHLEITSSNGATTYRNVNYSIPQQVTLPTTLGIATNGSSTASVVINASLWVGTTLLDDRSNQVFEIPTDRVAELDIVFSASCTHYAVDEADGGAASSCPQGQTCEPNAGCVSNVVHGGQLPTFSGDAGGSSGVSGPGPVNATLGDANEAVNATLGDANEAADGSNDSGSCAAGETLCGVACTNELTDNGNCGKCGANCGAGTSCQNGVCCPSGHTGCGGVCVDPKSDNANCGGCGLACSVGCDAGQCLVTLASAATNGNVATLIAVSGGTVYWTANGTVMSEPAKGGTVTTLYSGGGPFGIAVDSMRVYWTNQDPDGGLMYASLDGSAPTSIGPARNAKAFGIALDLTNVYWTDNVNPGAVWSAFLEGGGSFVAYGGQHTPAFIAASPAGLFWTVDDGFGSVWGAPLDGGSPFMLATDAGAPWAIAASSTTVYWTDLQYGRVMSVPADGGPPTTIASLDAGGNPTFLEVNGIALDSTNVYWSNAAGTLMTAPLDGGAVVTLVSLPSEGARGIAIDATSIYWTTNVGDVLKLTPK